MGEAAIHVVHVTPTVSRRGGGVAAYLRAVVGHTGRCGVVSTVVGLGDRYIGEDAGGYAGAEVLTGRRVGPASLGFSPGLRRCLHERLGRVDVVHSHGLRMMPGYEARRLACRRRVPLVISPHGQLDPWVLKTRVVRKWLVGLLYENRNLRTAACIHVTALQEARHVRSYGLRVPVAVVPIGLEVPDEGLVAEGLDVVGRWPELAGKKRLLFLSTIYPKKGLMRLAEAWARVHERWPGWQLVVAGQEISGDRVKAQSRLAEMGAADRCTFMGAVSERCKRQLLAAADVYVLATDGENFGIGIGEALAAGVPVITSNTTPWGWVQSHRCGWWIDVGVEPLCEALTQAMSLGDEQRAEMGRRGSALIRAHYAWPGLAERLRQMYAWLLGRSPKPGFVSLPEEPLPEDDQWAG